MYYHSDRPVQSLLHVYLDRESQHRLMSCMRMKTCMKMVAVWGYASGPGWCVSGQRSIRVRIWEIIHIRALGPRDREVNLQVIETSKVRIVSSQLTSQEVRGTTSRYSPLHSHYVYIVGTTGWNRDGNPVQNTVPCWCQAGISRGPVKSWFGTGLFLPLKNRKTAAV